MGNPHSSNSSPSFKKSPSRLGPILETKVRSTKECFFQPRVSSTHVSFCKWPPLAQISVSNSHMEQAMASYLLLELKHGHACTLGYASNILNSLFHGSTWDPKFLFRQGFCWEQDRFTSVVLDNAPVLMYQNLSLLV